MKIHLPIINIFLLFSLPVYAMLTGSCLQIARTQTTLQSKPIPSCQPMHNFTHHHHIKRNEAQKIDSNRGELDRQRAYLRAYDDTALNIKSAGHELEKSMRYKTLSLIPIGFEYVMWANNIPCSEKVHLSTGVLFAALWACDRIVSLNAIYHMRKTIRDQEHLHLWKNCTK